jgi:hypothetical protein
MNTWFNFNAFADEIYLERPVSAPPFLIPALYGGQVQNNCEVLFVLEAPSDNFTLERWSSCTSSAEAVTQHRRIFYDWAFRKSLPSLLFRGICGDASPQDFFERFYVTDIWKDARSRRTAAERDYWRAKLNRELNGVLAKHVVTLGSEARNATAHAVPRGTSLHSLPFPSPRVTNAHDFEVEVVRLLQFIQGRT